MAVPKRKTTPSRRNQRRAHDGLKPMTPNECQNCGALTRPHHVCDSCGFYGKKKIVEQRAPKTDDETTAA